MDSSSSIPPAVVHLRDVHVVYGRTLALDIEDLTIRRGERVFILGRSGSGKTTLSKLIKGRLKPTTGKLDLLGIDAAAAESREERRLARGIAMIDQEFYLVPRMTVQDNVLSGALGRVSTFKSLLGWFPLPELEKAADILGEVELEAYVDRRVETLSGGQRQRTAIARALMQDADIMIADEPVSALDPELAEDALDLLVACVERRNVTLLVNLHQPSLARRFASRIIGLSQGKVVYDGPPESFTEDAAEFLYRSEDAGGKVIEIEPDRPGEASS